MTAAWKSSRELFLPDAVGFYALDRDKLIREMKQSTGEVKTCPTGREVEKILSGVPLIPARGPWKSPTSRGHAPEDRRAGIFMRPADEREPRFRLLRAEIKGGHRIIDNVSVEFTGEEKHKTRDIEIQTWTPASGVFRYTVDQRLEPGEYAFVEMTADGISGYVWDFGIDLPGKKTKITGVGYGPGACVAASPSPNQSARLIGFERVYIRI